jgi:hypothetical protein
LETFCEIWRLCNIKKSSVTLIPLMENRVMEPAKLLVKVGGIISISTEGWVAIIAAVIIVTLVVFVARGQL